METLVIPAGEGRAFYLSEEQRLRIITPRGQQSADFFAFRLGASASPAPVKAPPAKRLIPSGTKL